MLILPPQLLLYLSMGPEEKIKYFEGGERAVTRFEEGPAGYEAKAFRGLGVFQSMPYEESEEAESVQMLERSTQVGEYYTMSPPAVRPKNDLVVDAEGKTIKNYMDILIYNEETDTVVPISFKQALFATGYGDNGLNLDAISDDAGLLRSFFGGNVPSRDDLVGAVEEGKWIPVCITIARPFIEHLTLSAIVTVSGRDTGATVFGPAGKRRGASFAAPTRLSCPRLTSLRRFLVFSSQTCRSVPTRASRPSRVCLGGGARTQLPFLCLFATFLTRLFALLLAQATTRTLLLNTNPLFVFSVLCPSHAILLVERRNNLVRRCHTKAVITKPQNVFIMRDIMCTSYVAGCNTRFFGTEDGKDVLEGPVKPSDVDTQISERLSASDGNDAHPSMLAFFSVYKEGKADGEPISLSARVLPWSQPVKDAKAGEKFPGGSTAFKAYEGAFNLKQLHEGEDTRAMENMAFVSAEQMKNSLCFVGPHRKFTPWSAKRYELVPGQGHFGADAIAGDARWRRGEAVDMRAARSAMMPFEMIKS